MWVKAASLVLIFFVLFLPTNSSAQSTSKTFEDKIMKELESGKNSFSGKPSLFVYSDTAWSGEITDGYGNPYTRNGENDKTYEISCGNDQGTISVKFSKSTEEGFLAIALIRDGMLLNTQVTKKPWGVVEFVVQCEKNGGGGCLIATATYGTEMSLQVQQLREIRDGKLLQTEAGYAFMSAFNSFYYTFSPAIADYERQNIIFKEAVKVTITPLIFSLSILNYADTEELVLAYGISVIGINLGIYIGIPLVVIKEVRKIHF